MFEDKGHEATGFQFDPSPHGVHMKILKYIGRNKRVLEVGCASGHFSKKLKEKGCFVVGIEIDPAAAKLAKKIADDVIIGDVEEISPLPRLEGSFDIIIFADVLEHLRRPDKVLKEFKRWLKPSGYVITNIPNAVRIEFRLKYLMGKFEYGRGLGQHPVTHLRFFTLETSRRLFEEAGYKIIKIEPTGLGSRLKILYNLFSWSFIIIAKPT